MEEEEEEEQEFQDAQSTLEQVRVARPVTVSKPPRSKSSGKHKKRGKQEVLYSSPGQPLSRQAHLYKEHRRISRGSVSSDSSTNGTQFTTRATEIMPTKKKPAKKPAPKVAAQPPADDEESPRTQRQKRRQKNTANLPSERKKQKQQQQQQDDDDDSATEYTSNGEEDEATFSKADLAKLLNDKKMVANFIKAHQKTEQLRLKSGRAKEEQMGSYNPAKMSREQKEVQKAYKNYVWRKSKFVNPKTKKNAAKAVYLALRGDYHTKASTLNEDGKY